MTINYTWFVPFISASFMVVWFANLALNNTPTMINNANKLGKVVKNNFASSFIIDQFSFRTLLRQRAEAEDSWSLSTRRCCRSTSTRAMSPRTSSRLLYPLSLESATSSAISASMTRIARSAAAGPSKRSGVDVVVGAIEKAHIVGVRKCK